MDINDFNLINLSEYCTQHGEDPSFQVDKCMDQGIWVNCTIEDCQVRPCLEDLFSQGYEAPTVCGMSGSFYNTQKDYCKAKVVSSTETDFILCDTEPCTTPKKCCVSDCLIKNQNYVPTCDDQEFIFYFTVENWCNAHCDDPSKHFCNDLGNTCSEEFCFIRRCKNLTNFFGACNVETASWSVIPTEHDYCLHLFMPSFEMKLCESIHPCNNDQDCEIYQCIETIGQEKEEVCATNVFFPSKLEYCKNTVMGSTIGGIIPCDGGVCQDQEDCCEANCMNESFL